MWGGVLAVPPPEELRVQHTLTNLRGSPKDLQSSGTSLWSCLCSSGQPWVRSCVGAEASTDSASLARDCNQPSPHLGFSAASIQHKAGNSWPLKKGFRSSKESWMSKCFYMSLESSADPWSLPVDSTLWAAVEFGLRLQCMRCTLQDEHVFERRR